MAARTFVVMGITGKQGGECARALLEKGEGVRGLTRNPNSAKSQLWKDMGVEMVSSADLSKAFAGCYGLFLMMTPNMDLIAPNEQFAICVNYVDAAVQAGIKHIVYSSVANNDKQPELLPAKWEIEQYIRSESQKHGYTWSVVRPVHFLENFLLDHNGEKHPLDNWPTTIKQPMDGDHRLWHIACADIGKVSAECLVDAEKYNGRVIDLAGDNVSGNEVVAEMNQAWGFSGNDAITFSNSPPLCFFTCLPICCCCFKIMRGLRHIKPLIEYYATGNYTIEIEKLREEFPFLMDTKSWVASLPKPSRQEA